MTFSSLYYVQHIIIDTSCSSSVCAAAHSQAQINCGLAREHKRMTLGREIYFTLKTRTRASNQEPKHLLHESSNTPMDFNLILYDVDRIFVVMTATLCSGLSSHKRDSCRKQLVRLQNFLQPPIQLFYDELLCRPYLTRASAQMVTYLSYPNGLSDINLPPTCSISSSCWTLLTCFKIDTYCEFDSFSEMGYRPWRYNDDQNILSNSDLQCRINWFDYLILLAEDADLYAFHINCGLEAD